MTHSKFHLSILLAFFISLCPISAKPVFIDYGVGGEGRELMKYFYDVHNEFYVDIGAYDPIFASNTLNLFTQGWDGINVEANPNRMRSFYFLRPSQINLNYAVGNTDQFVTLYDLAEDSSSTVSPKVKQYVKGYKPVMSELKLPSLDMKELCERYYVRKPLFLTIDIEGYGGKALETNDWKNEKCRPQIIFSEINEETKQAGFLLPQVILTKNGYKKMGRNVGLNQVYIEGKVYEAYLQKQKRSLQVTKNLSFQSIQSIASPLARLLKRSTQLIPHYSAETDDIFYYFAQLDKPILVNQINKFSNQISAKKNRPIFILNFNPHSSFLVLPNNKYTTSEVKSQGSDFLKIQVQNPQSQKYEVYVYDHKFEPAAEPRIINLENFVQPKEEIYKANAEAPILCPYQQQLNEIAAALQKSNKQSKMAVKQNSMMIKELKELKAQMKLQSEAEVNQKNVAIQKLSVVQNQQATHYQSISTALNKGICILAALIATACVINMIFICCFRRKISVHSSELISQSITEDSVSMSRQEEHKSNS